MSKQMKMMNGESVKSFWGTVLTAGAFALLMIPSAASAALMTLTFEDGAYDETILYPGGDQHGPYDWVESNGIRGAGFWAVDVGTPDAYFKQGHTHIRSNFHGTNRAERMHSWTGDMQGYNISLESGQAFDIVSIDYSIQSRDTTDPLMQLLPWAWGPEDAQLLISTSFDETAADISGQWTNIAVDDYGQPWSPWFTKNISGFTGITSFLLTMNVHYLSVDNIVLNVYDVDPIPEPSTALLIGLGLTALASRRQQA